MSCSERRKEIKRRRHRKKKLEYLKQKITKASVSEKTHIASKVRQLTPGAESLIKAWGLES